MHHNINIFSNNERVGIIKINLNTSDAELIYNESWIKTGFELSPHLKFSEQINSSSIKNFINNLLPEGKGKDFKAILDKYRFDGIKYASEVL